MIGSHSTVLTDVFVLIF